MLDRRGVNSPPIYVRHIYVTSGVQFPFGQLYTSSAQPIFHEHVRASTRVTPAILAALSAGSLQAHSTLISIGGSGCQAFERSIWPSARAMSRRIFRRTSSTSYSSHVAYPLPRLV